MKKYYFIFFIIQSLIYFIAKNLILVYIFKLFALLEYKVIINNYVFVYFITTNFGSIFLLKSNKINNKLFTLFFKKNNFFIYYSFFIYKIKYIHNYI